MTFGRALLGALVLAVAGCAGTAPAADTAVERLRPTVVAELPHDTDAFTQGLELAPDGALYEGTGLAGRSQMRELDPATGAVQREVPLPGRLFGEGITVVDDRIWQLTWRDGVALEWDRVGLTLRRQVPIECEGWGLCRDGRRTGSCASTRPTAASRRLWTPPGCSTPSAARTPTCSTASPRSAATNIS